MTHEASGNAESPAACPCPQGPGRTITDPDRHAAWHRLVAEQGSPDGLVNAATMREARGLAGTTAPAAPLPLKPRPVGTYAAWLPLFLNAVRAIEPGREFTTADLHGKIPDPPHPNHWGTAQTRAHKLRLIEPVVAQASELETTRNSLVWRWQRVAEAVAA